MMDKLQDNMITLSHHPTMQCLDAVGLYRRLCDSSLHAKLLTNCCASGEKTFWLTARKPNSQTG